MRNLVETPNRSESLPSNFSNLPPIVRHSTLDPLLPSRPELGTLLVGHEGLRQPRSQHHATLSWGFRWEPYLQDDLIFTSGVVAMHPCWNFVLVSNTQECD